MKMLLRKFSSELSPLVKQTWAVSAVLLRIVTCGFHQGYMRSPLSDLKYTDTPIKNDTSTSWLVSSIGPPNLIGILFSSCIMAWIGRRNAFILLSVPGILGWFFIWLAPNVIVLTLGHIFNEFTCESSIITGAMIIGEYSSPKYRGMFLVLESFAISLGSMIVHMPQFHWKTIAWISMAIQAISLAIAFTIPESPYWLVCKNKYDESEKAFYWLRGTKSKSVQELDGLIRQQQNRKQKNGISYQLQKYIRMDFFQPLIVVLFGFLLLEFSGRNYFPAYEEQIMEKITGNKINLSMCALTTEIIKTICTLLCAVLVTLIRRRTLIFVSGFTATIAGFAGSTCILLISNWIISDSLSWLSLAFFVTFFVLVNLGCTQISLVLLGEIIPLQHRATGSALIGVITSCIMWLIINSLPYVLESLKIYGTFGIFEILKLFTLIVLYFTLPETKDRTMEEIGYNFRNGCYENEENEEMMSIIENTKL